MCWIEAKLRLEPLIPQAASSVRKRQTKDIPAPDKQPEEMLRNSTTCPDIYGKKHLDSKAGWCTPATECRWSVSWTEDILLYMNQQRDYPWSYVQMIHSRHRPHDASR